MAVLLGEYVVGHSDELDIVEVDTCLLERLATYTCDRLLTELEMTAWRTPRTGAVRPAAQAQKNGSLLEHEYTGAHEWPR
jgi:hypothetical protein